jgi:hypothetical protein
MRWGLQSLLGVLALAESVEHFAAAPVLAVVRVYQP